MEPLIAGLDCAFDAVGAVIAGVRADQWSEPTPCTEWDVRRVVEHLIGMNRVFAALLADAPPPTRPAEGHVEPDPLGTYRESAAALVAAFGGPGALEREYAGPMGSATGTDRLQIRQYDLLAHGWDLAQATGQPLSIPEDLAEQSFRFARAQVADGARAGRFAPATAVRDDAPAMDRLVAFLGRTVRATPGGTS